jgi:acetolactate synthase small subunit
MMKLSDILQTQGVVAAVSTLRASRFFNHEELRRIAEEAERAFSRLEAVLDGRQSI